MPVRPNRCRLSCPSQENKVLIDWAETRGNKQDDERGVYITGLDEKVDEAGLRKHFGSYGTIVKVRGEGRQLFQRRRPVLCCVYD